MNDTFMKAYQDQIEAAKKAFGGGTFPGFELPKGFELPQAFEVPPAFREMAEKSLGACRENYEKLKAAAERTSDMVEDSCTQAGKGLATYNMKAIEAIHSNVNATFDYYTALLSAKSLPEAMELSSAHVRKQFEVLSSQAKDLTSLAQKVAAETSEPLKAGVEKNINAAA